ncbi:MAG: hypothetical protein DLD55_01110 [candidate division SR1 bacterium]|nr:MAG: hypothetical protein DLD55_01110 [candidate division SR1 bacterium]
MQRIGVLNGNNITYDHDLAGLVRGLTDGGVIQGGEISENKVQPVQAVIACQRSNGQKLMLYFESDEQVAIPSSGIFKVYIEVNQAKIDDGSENAENGTGIAEIKTGPSVPSQNSLLLASVADGAITDERNLIPKIQSVAQKTSTLEEKITTAEEQIQGIQTNIQEMGAVKGLSFKAIPNGEIRLNKKTAIFSLMGTNFRREIYMSFDISRASVNLTPLKEMLRNQKDENLYFGLVVVGEVNETVKFDLKIAEDYSRPEVFYSTSGNFTLKKGKRDEIIFSVPRELILSQSINYLYASFSCPSGKCKVNVYNGYGNAPYTSSGIYHNFSGASFYDKNFEFYVYSEKQSDFALLGIKEGVGLSETYKNFIGITKQETDGILNDKVDGDEVFEGKIFARKIKIENRNIIKGVRLRAIKNGTGDCKFSLYGADSNGNIKLTEKLFEQNFLCENQGKFYKGNTQYLTNFVNDFEIVAKKDGVFRVGARNDYQNSNHMFRVYINDSQVVEHQYNRETSVLKEFDVYVKAGDRVRLYLYGRFIEYYSFFADSEINLDFNEELGKNKEYFLVVEGVEKIFGIKKTQFSIQDGGKKFIWNKAKKGKYRFNSSGYSGVMQVAASSILHTSPVSQSSDQFFEIEQDVDSLIYVYIPNDRDNLSFSISPYQAYISDSTSLSTLQEGDGLLDISFIYEPGDAVEVVLNGSIIELPNAKLVPGERYCLYKGVLISHTEMQKLSIPHNGFFGRAITENLLLMNYTPTNTNITTGNAPLGMPMGYATIGGHVVPIYG